MEYLDLFVKNILRTMRLKRNIPPPILLALTVIVSLYSETIIVKASSTARPQVFYNITEGDSERTLIGNVAYDAGLFEVYSETIRSTFNYRWLRQDSDVLGQQLFGLDEDRAELRIERTIDREELCSRDPVCELRFDVAVTPVPEMFLMVIQVSLSYSLCSAAFVIFF